MKPKSKNSAYLEINLSFQCRQQVYPLNWRKLLKWVLPLALFVGQAIQVLGKGGP